MSRFFVALLPPQDIQAYANEIKQYFADCYASRHAQKSPLHITLQPPFAWADDKLSSLEVTLRKFANQQKSLLVTLDGFNAFAHHVIYIDVVRSQELLTLQADLMMHIETSLGIVDEVGKKRPFAPHMTVAFRDLTRQNFQAAWQEFENRQLHSEFTADKLTLLLHDGKQWKIKSEFTFLTSNE
ncbi:2'-5' RNA ligase family protein [Fortiea sp. LEGE XX443]|uniref:2'-5' RNA ligase family protein n=1 Tax=Fortiea sp. LEGE XX443 TaxID=1828611 RepID=UPI0018826C63|nr:2'-5' RNA ligase family protein [Fortiea sp. LEGE XX443]MBE9004368.1 2'-5' RNA ligase family protein [Fortiea sp. LEGE XX443]